MSANKPFVVNKSLAFHPQTTAPANPAEGQIYLNDTQGYLVYQSGVWVPFGSGSGQGEINYIKNPSGQLGTTHWEEVGAGISIEQTQTASELPRESLTAFGLKITPISGTDYVRTRFTLGDADKGKQLKIQSAIKALSGYVSGDLNFEMWTNTASDYSGSYTQLPVQGENIPAGDGVYLTQFASTSADYYELRIARVSGTTAIILQDLVVGPGSLASVPNVSLYEDTTSYTINATGGAAPTPDGGATFYRRTQKVGSWARIRYEFNNGAGAGSPGDPGVFYTLPLPAGISIDFGRIGAPDTVLSYCGNGHIDIGGGTADVSCYINGVNNEIGVAIDDNAGALNIWGYAYGALNGIATLGLEVVLPIAEWQDNIFSAQTATEYAWNSDTSDANDTTSFAYGQGGGLVPNSTVARIKRIKFKTKRLPTDVVSLQLLDPAGSTLWDAAENLVYGPDVDGSGNIFGYYFDYSSVADPETEVNVVFVQYIRPGGTFTWSTLHAAGYKWRVVKSSNPLTIGHDLVGQNKAGLVQAAGQLKGTNTNDNAEAGNVGEYLEDVYPGIVYSTTGVWVDAAQLTLTPGDWEITHQDIYDTQGTGVTTHTQLIGISVNSGNSFTDFADGDTAVRSYHSSSTTYSSLSVTIRRSISSTTTYYAKVRADNVNSPDPSFYGKLFARRIR